MSFINRLSSSCALMILAASLAICAPTAQAQSAAATTGTASAAAANSVAPAAVSNALPDITPAGGPTVQANPYGLKAIISHGDLVSRSVLVLLMLMSLGSWYIIVTKLFEQRKLLAESSKVGAGSTFWESSSVAQASEGLAAEGAFRYIAETALEATHKHSGVLAQVDLSTWLATSLDEAGEEVEHRLQKGLGFLATVGSTSPFVGLFGTVWGILNALTSIGMAGQASIDKVAGPVGEALIMTAIGLAVAVPAVLGYNWLVGRNGNALHYVNSFRAKLRTTLLATTATTRT